MNTTTNPAINEFANTFFENRSDKAPYAEYVRFRKAMPATMQLQEIEAIYESFAKHPAYYEKQSFYSDEELADAKSIVLNMLQYLDGEPASFADIYIKYLENHGFNIRYKNVLPHIPYEAMLRKFFKELAQNNLIRCIEVKTCGKVAIRLYWL